ncbi:uncharacterized protein TrAtP1_000365 [Trichoderma atroviride]|uniref:uncharacterized protein n=1 Tax=Hypocrea atroviridis TaxID=63577 RepID=UPI0033233811|nr:hypothetical protein TrAtP1_000365 [Trichoderma atroviride]
MSDGTLRDCASIHPDSALLLEVLGGHPRRAVGSSGRHMELSKLDDGTVSVAAAARWSAYRVPSRVPSGAQILPPKAYSVGDLAKAPATHALSHIESPEALVIGAPDGLL